VKEQIFLGIDADTCIAPEAISLLVPHFADPNVAAVAGNVKVANQVNLWTRWQALEYITSQNLERRALDVFGVVTVVPGAIGAWRMSAVKEAGSYQTNTLAEDADLTMALLRQGYRVHYEDCALAFTEVPSDAQGLMRQRFRWSFGILQSVWKHRALFKRKGPVAWVALPNIVVFQFLLPLVSPFIDLAFVFSVVSCCADRHSHFESQNGTLIKLMAAFLVFMFTDLAASALAFTLERRGSDRGENPWLLAYVWLQRFAYRQLFWLVIVKTLNRAVQGCATEWCKLERTAALQCEIAEEMVALQYYHEEDSAKAA
jgi:cellulose synthase/poly-beta-1,6-N-acetylglucosamine synthase-like glycosyltransferase